MTAFFILFWQSAAIADYFSSFIIYSYESLKHDYCYLLREEYIRRMAEHDQQMAQACCSKQENAEILQVTAYVYYQYD